VFRPTFAEIDLSAIEHNVRAIRARVGPHVRIMPAVKADGYGHGAIEVGKTCLSAGADVLCVASIEEAADLRESGIEAPILILGCLLPDAVEAVLDYELATTVCDLAYAEALSKAALARGTRPEVHLKVDTGMGRLGVDADRAVEFGCAISELGGLKMAGLFTHFPSADEADKSFTLEQISLFRRVVESVKKRGISVGLVHASNSGGILAYPEADFDAVRPGVIVYGVYPSSEVEKSIELKPAMSLKTRIVYLKNVAPGSSVSYGRTYVVNRRSVIATVPVGYADGYPRSLSNKGSALVRGCRVPVVGRVCMDQSLVDVTDVPDVQVGDEVVLYGGGWEFLDLTTTAESIGTIPYELMCAVSARVPRVYRKSSDFQAECS